MPSSPEKRDARGPELAPHQVVIRPLVTEKGTHLVERHNTYAFQVHPFSTKDQIRDAVQYLFEVKVLSVRTQNRAGKRRRFKGHMAQGPAWKKAFVTLGENDRINLF